MEAESLGWVRERKKRDKQGCDAAHLLIGGSFEERVLMLGFVLEEVARRQRLPAFTPGMSVSLLVPQGSHR